MTNFDDGYKYQLSVTAYLATLLSQNEAVTDYRIFYEVQQLYPFDDLVLAVNFNKTNEFRLYAIQVKSGKITKNKIDVNKYLNGYNKIKREKKWECLENIGKIDEEIIQYWYYACQSFSSLTTSIQEGSEMKELEIKRRISDNNESIIYNEVHELFSADEDVADEHQDFFDDFYIFLEQPNRNKIEYELKRMWKSNDAPQIIDYLDKCFRKYKKRSLSKMEFERELLRIRLLKYIVPPIKVIPCKEEPAHAWIDLTLSHNVTIVENASYIEVCLFGCILRKIADVISIDEWNKCAGDEEVLISQGVKAKFSGEIFKPQTLKDLVIQLWLSNKIPLILKSENQLPVLKEFSHLDLHYIIIDSNVDTRYSEMKRYNLSVIKDLGGLQDDKLLKSISVSMQGRKPSSLYTVINNDENLMKTLTCSNILRLIEPKKVYLKEECLRDGNNVLFVIEKDIKQQDEHYKTVEDNILIYCPPNQGDVFYQNALKNPKFKSFRIYRLYSQISENSEEKLMLMHEHESDYEELKYYFIEQYGNSVYAENKYNAVPVIGEVINMSCPRYLSRRLRKGVINIKNSPEDGINPLIDYTELPFPETSFFNETSRKICVVTGEPGMGKTTFLRSLIQKCEAKHYVLFCDLALYQTDLYDESRKLSELCKDPLNLLCNKYISLPYKTFLSTLRNDRKRLIIILDSLDEIVATCRQNVLNLIEKLKSEVCLERIIIGTRLLTINLLNNQFDFDLIEIQGFSTEFNVNYIQNWNFDENTIQNIPAELRKNPLYLNFLRTITGNGINIGTLNRWNLYKTIIDLKIIHYYQRINQNPDSTDKDNILKYYYALALETLFPYSTIAKKLGENRKENYTNLARIGLIKCFDKKGFPVFIHRTFVEFLISRWLIETPDKNDAKSIYRYILDNHLYDTLHVHSEQFRLHKAVIDQDLTRVQNLCEQNPELLKQKDELGRTALHLAAMHSFPYYQRTPIQDTIIQYTLANNFDLYPYDSILNWSWVDCYQNHKHVNLYRLTSVSVVIQESFWTYQAVKVRKGIFWAFLNDNEFYNFYREALKIPSISIIKNILLLKYYHNKHFRIVDDICLHSNITTVSLPETHIPELQSTLMHFGCIYSNANVVSACIERGDDINATDSFGCTPLYYSICSQNSEIVQLLLEKGANMKLNPTKEDFITIFTIILLAHNNTIMTMLIKLMDKDLKDWDHSTPLHDAIAYERTEVVAMLLNAGANINIPDEHGDTPLHCAVRTKNRNLIALVLKYNPNVNATNHEGETPLSLAAKIESVTYHDILMVQLLLYAGANVNITNKYGDTPLHNAVKRQTNSNEVIRVLLQYGADVHATNTKGETPLFYAVEKTGKTDKVETIEILLNANANVNITDESGDTFLHKAIYSRLKNTM